MNRFLKFVLVSAATIATFVSLRAAVAKYTALVTAAIAVWNDPQVKKVRRRAVKKIAKAHRAAQKA